MRFADIDRANRLASKLTSLQERRGTWTAVGLTGTAVARRINANGSSPDRLPMLDDDEDMHCAIVKAIIDEYATRIAATEAELKELGVEL